jgi:hypothetical protein
MQNFSISWRVSGVPAASATFIPSAAAFVAPLPSGTVIGHIDIQPADWEGTILLSGANSDCIAVNSSRDVVTVTVLTAGDYSATGLVAP